VRHPYSEGGHAAVQWASKAGFTTTIWIGECKGAPGPDSALRRLNLRLNHKPLGTPFRACPLFYEDGAVDQDALLAASSLRTLRVGGTRTLRRKGAQPCPGPQPGERADPQRLARVAR
jgi:hypothetical protein